MNIADTAGVASLIIQTDIEDGEGALYRVLAFNQVFAAVGEMCRIECPGSDVHRL